MLFDKAKCCGEKDPSYKHLGALWLVWANANESQEHIFIYAIDYYVDRSFLVWPVPFRWCDKDGAAFHVYLFAQLHSTHTGA